jgi:hypothetical protein
MSIIASILVDGQNVDKARLREYLAEREAVDSIAGLKALNAPSTAAVIVVLGYYLPQDLGGGLYYWNASDTRADNGGTIIQPASVPAIGRWNLIYTRGFSVRQFGATADGTDVTNRINAAIDALAAGETLFFSGGQFGVGDALNRLPDNSIVLFSGDAVLTKVSGAGNIVFFTPGNYCKLKVSIDAHEGAPFGSGSQSYGICSDAASPAVGVEVFSSRFTNCMTPIRGDGGQNWNIHDNYFDTCQTAVLMGATAVVPLKNVNVHHNFMKSCHDVAVGFFQIDSAAIIDCCVANYNIAVDTNLTISGFAFDLEAATIAGTQTHVEFSHNILLQLTTGTTTGRGGAVIGDLSARCKIHSNILIGNYESQSIGVNIKKTINTIVEGNVIYNFHGDGVDMSGSTSGRVRDNNVLNCGSTSGSYCGIKAGYIGLTTSDADINGNWIENLPGFAGAGRNGGIWAYNSLFGPAASKGLRIRHNTIKGITKVSPILIQGNAAGSEYQFDEVSGNKITGANDTLVGAIRISHTRDGCVAFNNITDCATGIWGNNNVDIYVGPMNIVRDNGAGVLAKYVEMTTSANCQLIGNRFSDTTSKKVTFSGTNLMIRDNEGYVTENSGLALIANGVTSVTVNHGCDAMPAAKDFSLVVINNPTSAPGLLRIGAITATQVTLHCAADPGVSGLSVGWKVEIRP